MYLHEGISSSGAFSGDAINESWYLMFSISLLGGLVSLVLLKKTCKD